MKITIVGINYTPEVTGIAPYTTGLAEGLTARGHQVAVVTGLPHYPEWRIRDEYRGRRAVVETIGGVRVRRVNHYVPERNPSVRTRVLMESSFAVAAATAPWADPDLVLAVSPALLSTAAVVTRARLQGIPVGVIVQDLYGKGATETGALGGRSARVLSRLEAWALSSASGVAVIHERFAGVLKRVGIPRDCIAVVRNWTHIGIEGDTVRCNVTDIRRRYGWDNDLVVLHAGNMGVKQDLGNVVAAGRLAATCSSNRKIRFVLVGDGNQRRQLEKAATGVSSVEFVAPLPDAEFRGVLAAADVLLVNERPGVGEMAVPSKLTTYFTTGHPVLAATDTTSGAATEVRAAGAGIVVEPGNPRSLLDGAIAIASDGERAHRFGEAAKDYSRNVLDRHAAIAHYDQWCEDLVGTRRR